MNKGEIALISRVTSSLNHSTSKMCYSFSRAERFKTLKRDYSYHFYNIPSKMSNRSCSMGYGEKSDFTKDSRNKCSSQYAFPSLFDPKYHNSPQYSFGTSRIIKKTRNVTPGPKYDITNVFGADAPSITIGEKLGTKSNRNQVSPGPGSYNIAKNSELGHYYESRFRNASAINLDTKAKRFKYYYEPTPGPAKYKLPSLINKSGLIYESRFESVPARSFIGKKNIRIKRDISPGPGQYDSFSEFEGYEAKHKNKV